MAPKTRGVNVLTRPLRISGAPDHDATGVTSIPASLRCLAVPPVERISTPFARRACANSMMPLLSETERVARSIRILNDAGGAHRCRRPDVSPGFPPDVVVQVHDIGDGVRVADRCHCEGRRAVIKFGGSMRSAAAKILFVHQRRE